MKKLLALLVLISPILSRADTVHTLSWRGWDAVTDTEKVQVIWDDKSLGGLLAAYEKLNTLNLTSHDLVHIELPVSVDLSKLHRPPYWCAKFISTWNQKRVQFAYFQEGKEYPVHTLAVTGFDLTGGNWQDNYKAAHLIFDQKDIGMIEKALKHLESYQWQQGVILQFLEPKLPDTDMSDRQLPPALISFLGNLERQGSVVIEHISPLK